METEVTKSSAQRAYEQLEERRREVLSRRLEEKASASSTDNTEVKNKTDYLFGFLPSAQFLKQRKDPNLCRKKISYFRQNRRAKKRRNEMVEKIEENLGKQNSFNFYYGFSVPNLSEYDGERLNSKMVMNLAWSIYEISDFSLGAGYSYKAFENERWSMTGSPQR